MQLWVHTQTPCAQEAARGKPATRLGKLQENQKNQKNNIPGLSGHRAPNLGVPRNCFFWFFWFFLFFWLFFDFFCFFGFSSFFGFLVFFNVFFRFFWFVGLGLWVLVARASRCVFRSAGLAVREKCEKAHSHSVPFCIYIYTGVALFITCSYLPTDTEFRCST